MYNIFINNKPITADSEKLTEVLAENGYYVSSPCGGHGRCGKCIVWIDGKKALACTSTIYNGMHVFVPEAQKGKIAKGGIQRKNILYKKSGIGAAFDIGTTTVVGYLVDMTDGSIIAVEAEMNRQKIYGADVMSRVEHCLKSGMDDISGVIQNQINEMTNKMLSAVSIDKMNLTKTVIAANTVMSHIYMKADISGLAHIPFESKLSGTQKVGSTVLMPCIFPYVGGDITAALLACDIDSEDKTVMLIDLGTNGEIVLKHNGTYYCCSVSAGPALEGAGISCGTGSVSGAIYRFELISGIPSIKTIGEETANGVCGSGIVDIVAALLDDDIIDTYGTFKSNIMNINIKRYVRNGAYYINPNVYVTQHDIREVQTVKSAVRSGIEMIMKSAGIDANAVEQVYLAGGLGEGIRAESAFRIGLFPKEFTNKITVCGNASGSGAVAALCDDEIIKLGEEISKKAILVELGGNSEFQDLFLKNINF